MEFNPTSSSSRVDRRTVEKNRRIHMKALYSKLHSLVPHNSSSREVISLPDQLQEAANYIKKLQIKLEKMNEEKDNLMGIQKLEINHEDKIKNSNLMVGQQRIPRIDVRGTGSSLEAILITGVDFQFLFSETIRVIHEEGFDVINATFSIVNDTVFHTIHAQIGENYAQENGVSRITERLNSIAYGI
ncbi:transcription factor bHLH162 [Lactuca sativa]|uniref:transcription factor bHLH162 n=1 Tax=Lactuca sativa TaxID=4236 RepID=UPI000CBAB45B|nr:transcription factor bHLH162 [Lactuca sativa]